MSEIFKLIMSGFILYCMYDTNKESNIIPNSDLRLTNFILILILIAIIL